MTPPASNPTGEGKPRMERDVRILSQEDPSRFIDAWYELAGAQHFWMQWRHRVFCRFCRDLSIPLDEPWRGLDVGCGQGTFIGQLEADTAWITDGADLDLTSMQRSAARIGEFYFYNILERRDEFREKYDFIVLFDVIEHIEDAAAFVTACRFHLRPGGYLFINVPAGQHLYGPYDKAAGHFRRYDKPLMRQHIPAEFTVCGMRYWGFTMVPLLMLRNLVTSEKASTDDIIVKGFRPPGRFAHAVLKTVMKMETTVIHNPFAGSSLMAVFRLGA